MINIHTLGFPRMGANRELKTALEQHWRGELSTAQLEAAGRELRARHWALQREAGLDFVTVGDFAFYDHMANHIQLLGCEPARFDFSGRETELARYFAMARGTSGGEGRAALEMTKWFDTNYHYLVPEFLPGTTFRLASERLFDEAREARARAMSPKAAASKDASLSSKITVRYSAIACSLSRYSAASKSGRSAMRIFLVMVYSSIVATSFTALAISAGQEHKKRSRTITKKQRQYRRCSIVRSIPCLRNVVFLTST